MKKYLVLIVSLFFLMVLTSCSNNTNTNEEPKMVNVELSTNPKTGKVNEPITFKAKVTQGEEKVNDADEVVFEIWRSKDAKHEKYEIKHPKDGIYSMKKTFQQEGTYYIVSHVTARGMHNMPKKEFIVGTPSKPEDSNASSSMDGMTMDKDKKGH